MVTGRRRFVKRETLDVKSYGGRALGSSTFHLSPFTFHVLERVRRCAATVHLQALLLTLVSILVSPLLANTGTLTAQTGSALEREATEFFNRAEYGQVLKLWQSLPPETATSKPFIRLAFQSSLKLGRPEEALTLYQRLVPTDQPDDPALLRPLSLSFLTSHVRDSQEYVRIAAYTILAELGLPETQAVLEDGLLDASVLVRARAADAIGKAGLAGKSGPLRRALNDAMPAVRIAAMNALSEAHVTDIMPYLIEVARVDDGPEAVFAYAALYRLGKQDMLTDITGAVTLPDPEVRMAALGALGRLKRPSSLSVLSQGVYDPEPSVRAFAAGALGDYGQVGGVAPLTHALGDESAHVRAVAATSLGRLGIRDNLTVAAGSHARYQYAGTGQRGRRIASIGRHIGYLACGRLGQTRGPFYPSSGSPYAGCHLRQASGGHPTDAPARPTATTSSSGCKSTRQDQRIGDAAAQKDLARLGSLHSFSCRRQSAPTATPFHNGP